MIDSPMNAMTSLLLAQIPGTGGSGDGNKEIPTPAPEPMTWDRATEILWSKWVDWTDAAIALLPNVLLALLTLVAFYLIGSTVRRALDKLLQKAFDSGAIAQLVATICSWLVILIGLFIAFDLVGLQKAVLSLLAGAGIIGLAIGFAFQDLAENLIAGFLLGIRKPFTPGDLIQSQSQLGFVQQLNLRNTIIRNFSGQVIYIPNKEVFKNVLENYSKSGKRRIEIPVGVSYGEDLEEVSAVLREAVQGLDFLREDEQVSIYAVEFGDSSINFSVRYWIDYPGGQVEYLEAIDRGIKAIKSALDDKDILIPFPIRTLDFGIKGGISLPESVGPLVPSSDRKD
ncbi:MAG: mechanosensitive ion channel family protein [Akkermansiaceae bacterium]|nr:mechanosensitive ion channel family protein [Akkermansiaceae bacterium]